MSFFFNMFAVFVAITNYLSLKFSRTSLISPARHLKILTVLDSIEVSPNKAPKAILKLIPHVPTLNNFQLDNKESELPTDSPSARVQPFNAVGILFFYDAPFIKHN